MSSFRHSDFLNNIPGFGKWAQLNINLDSCFWCECIYKYIHMARVNEYVYIYIHIYTYIYTFIYTYVFIGIVSFQISQLFLQKILSQPDSWVVENSSYKICQLKFCKFQVVMFSEKNTFATAIVNIFRESSLINHKWWICLLIFTFMSTSEASYSKWSEFLYF